MVHRPSIKASLLDELDANEWAEGWAAGGVLFDAQPESWDEHRQVALRFYHSADIEYGQGFGFTFLGQSKPFDARQPPHLSAQSDLYWAMRVGYADAHIEGGDERRPTLSGIADAVERVGTIVSMTAHHTLRTEYQMDRHWEALEKGLPPTQEYWRLELQRVLSQVWEQLPAPTVQHLIDAMDKGNRKDPDAQRVDTAKAVESLLEKILKPKLVGLRIETQTRKETKTFHVAGQYSISLMKWSGILATANPGQSNEPAGAVLAKSFPGLNLQAVSALAHDLDRIRKLRGSAAHYSSESESGKLQKSTELWDLVVGGVGRDGFLARFCFAFGLAEPGPTRKGTEDEASI